MKEGLKKVLDEFLAKEGRIVDLKDNLAQGKSLQELHVMMLATTDPETRLRLQAEAYRLINSVTADDVPSWFYQLLLEPGSIPQSFLFFFCKKAQDLRQGA